jgi:hypothetical protein
MMEQIFESVGNLGTWAMKQSHQINQHSLCHLPLAQQTDQSSPKCW